MLQEGGQPGFYDEQSILQPRDLCTRFAAQRRRVQQLVDAGRWPGSYRTGKIDAKSGEDLRQGAPPPWGEGHVHHQRVAGPLGVSQPTPGSTNAAQQRKPVPSEQQRRRPSNRWPLTASDTIYALPGVQNDMLLRGALRRLDDREARRSTPGTSRARPIWRSAPRLRPASPPAYAVVPGQGPVELLGRPSLAHLPDERAAAGADQQNAGRRHWAGTSGICMKSATRPTVIERLVDHSALIRKAEQAPRRVAEAMRAMAPRDGRVPGLGSECAVDRLRGKSGAVDTAATVAGASARRSTRPRSAEQPSFSAPPKNPIIVAAAPRRAQSEEVRTFNHAAGPRAGLPARPRRAGRQAFIQRHAPLGHEL